MLLHMVIGVSRGSIAAKCCKFFPHLFEASLTIMRLAFEHRYTLQTVTPLVLSSAGVVCDVSGPALGHAAKIVCKFAYNLYLFL